MDLSQYIDAVTSSRTKAALDEVLIDAISSLGGTALSGHTFPFGSRARSAKEPIISTWPPEAQKVYRAHMAGEDPIMFAAMSMGAPVHFLELRKTLSLSQKEAEVISMIKETGFQDVVGTPAYAKPGVYAYFAAAFPEPRPDLKWADLRRFKFIFSEYFYQYCELTRVKQAALSRREREVLLAIVNDKSNTEIADMLGVSEHTVGTYVRRCFTKLDVNSRTQAVLRYLNDGFEDMPSLPETGA